MTKIADIFLQYIKVPFMRSAENANDFAGLAQVAEEVFDNYKNKGVIFDFVCCIYLQLLYCKSKI